MFGFDDAQQAHQDVYGQDGQPDNQATFTGEALGGAAAFEAMRKYEQHEEANGKPENHQMAKEVLAGFAGVEADRLVQTKGEDFYDSEKIKRQAQDNASNYYDQKYQGGGDQGGDGGYGGQQGGDDGYGGQQGGDGGYGGQQGGY